MSRGKAFVQLQTDTNVASVVNLDAGSVLATLHPFNGGGSSFENPVIDSTNTYAYISGAYALELAATWQVNVATNSLTGVDTTGQAHYGGGRATCISNGDTYLYCGFGGYVEKYALPSLTWVANIASFVTQPMTSATTDPTRSLLYFGCEGDSSNAGVIQSFNTSSQTFAIIYTAAQTATQIVVGSVSGNLLFFTEADYLHPASKIVHALDLTTHTVAWSVTCTENVTSRPICNNAGTFLYVGNSGSAVTTIDVGSHTVIHTTPVTSGAGVYGLAVTQDDSAVAFTIASDFGVVPYLYQLNTSTYLISSVTLGHGPGLLCTTRGTVITRNAAAASTATFTAVAVANVGAVAGTSTTTFRTTAVATVTSGLTNSIVMIV